MAQLQQTFALAGGLDLVTPAIVLPPGFAIAAQNYEPEAKGYSRVKGHERYDGRPAPSDATWTMLDFDGGVGAITAGQTVTGATSAATGLAAVDAVVESGSYGGSDAAGYLILYNVSGTFQDNEALQVSAVTKVTANGIGTSEGSDTDADYETFLEAVTAARRTAIQKPTGSGAIRGVATYNGTAYCWRDNAGGTAGSMFKATTSGWAAQSFGHYIKFDAGTAEPAEGDTITGLTSGASGVLRRLVLQSGAWSGTAAGYMVLSGVSGTFQDNEKLQVGGANKADADGTQVAIALPAGATVEALEANFYATSTGNRLYFVTTTGTAFEWDGTYLVPILVPGLSAAQDKPTHLAVHRNHLFLCYPGGSLQNSSTGEPLQFIAATGAGEIGFGQEITGLLSDTRDSLIVAGRNKIGYLVGADATEFDLRSVTESSGAVAGSLQVATSPLFLDDQGVRDLQASQVYGDWKVGALTQRVEPMVRSARDGGATVLGSLRVRGKDQYRLYWSDGSALCLYFGRKEPEAMPITLGFTPSCFCSGEDASGNEALFAGGTDGYVYALDKGTSFDGEAISAYVRLAFAHQGAPNQEKRYHRARLEGRPGGRGTDLVVACDLAYGGEEQPASSEATLAFPSTGGFWDTAAWNEFHWDSQVESQAWIELDGVGENVSVVIASDSATEDPHTLSALTIAYTPRRRLR